MHTSHMDIVCKVGQHRTMFMFLFDARPITIAQTKNAVYMIVLAYILLLYEPSQRETGLNWKQEITLKKTNGVN